MGIALPFYKKWPLEGIKILDFDFLGLLILILAWFVISNKCFAVNLPGTDVSSKLEAAGTLLRLVDTAIFKWGTRVFAGLCICGAGWSLKEQRFGTSMLCVIAALIIGTSPTWVKNIFSIGGGDSIFSHQMIVPNNKGGSYA